MSVKMVMIIPAPAPVGGQLPDKMLRMREILDDVKNTPKKKKGRPKRLMRDGVTFEPDDIVLMIHPALGVMPVTANDSRIIEDLFSGGEINSFFPLSDLEMVYRPTSVWSERGKKYLTGYALVYCRMDDWCVSADDGTVSFVRRIMEVESLTINHNGKTVMVLPL